MYPIGWLKFELSVGENRRQLEFSWWVSKFVPLKNCVIPQKLTIKCPVTYPGHVPMNTHVHQKNVTAAVFRTGPNGEHPKCPTTVEWINFEILL